MRALAVGMPVIYANDNFGRWRSDFSAQVRHVREDGTRGAPVAEALCPASKEAGTGAPGRHPFGPPARGPTHAADMSRRHQHTFWRQAIQPN